MNITNVISNIQTKENLNQNPIVCIVEVKHTNPFPNFLPFSYFIGKDTNKKYTFSCSAISSFTLLSGDLIK